MTPSTATSVVHPNTFKSLLLSYLLVHDSEKHSRWDCLSRDKRRPQYTKSLVQRRSRHRTRGARGGTRGRSSGDGLRKFIHSGNWYGKAASQPPKLMSLDRHSLFSEPYFGLKAIDNEDGYEIFLALLHLFFSSYHIPHHSKPWTFRS